MKESQESKSYNRQVAILFLAHNGIMQPDVWREWREWRDELQDGQDKILFYGILPEDENDWIRVKGVDIKNTGWCTPSLVYAEQQGLRQILEEDKEKRIKLIFFVSGDSIPILDADTVYKFPDKTFWSHSENLDGNNTKEYEFKHTRQWKSYNRKDAEKIAQFDFTDSKFQKLDLVNRAKTNRTREKKIQSLLQERKKYMDIENNARMEQKEVKANKYEFIVSLINLQLVRIRALEEGLPIYYYISACPDEFWIPSVLQKPDAEHDIVTFSKTSDSWYPPVSPITWNSWHKEYEANPNSYLSKFDLKSEILRAYHAQVPFFRKIARDLPLLKSSKRPWKFLSR